MEELNRFITRLLKARSGLMGMAMLAVVFYHMHCWLSYCPLLKAFKWGFIGVDVFLLVSGFGLCYSYNGNRLLIFYKRRICRIFPLQITFCLLTFAAACMFSARPLTMLFKRFLLSSSTLYYWLPGCDHGNWFVPSLLLLYLLFPLFYRFVSAARMKGVLLIAVLCLVYSYWFAPHIGWYYDCLVSRIPVFCLGIMLYFVVNGEGRLSAVDVLGWSGVLALAISFNVSRFFVTAMACPLFVLAVLPALTIERIRKYMDFFGAHSFELFLGNEFGFSVAGYFLSWRDCSSGIGVPLFLLTAFLGFVVFCGADMVLKKLLGMRLNPRSGVSV